MDDDALMRRVADGDRQAFAEIIKAYQGRLVRFAARFLGDSDAAQDAAQETFLRLWRLRHRYQPRSCLLAYLLRTIRNVCVDYTRAAWPCEVLASECESALPGPEILAEQKSLADAVAQAVLSLPGSQRAVFILS